MGDLRNVALCRVGTWSASTGVTKITAEDLTSMAAAYADTLVDRPPVKIGHDNDNAFNAALGDGEPAYGWIENVGVGDGSADRPETGTLYGDLVGMPDKLAEVAPKAFRRRSVEIAWGVRAASGKAYRAVLTGLALLGAKPPAVKGLADVLALYSDVSDAQSITQVVLVDGLDAEQTSALSEALSAFAATDAVLDAIDTGSVPHAPVAPGDGDTTDAAASAATDTTKGKPMGKKVTKSDLTAALDGLKDKAADEDVTELVNGLLAAEDAEDAEDGTEDEADKDKGQEGASALSGVTLPEGMVVLSAEQLSALTAGATAGITAQAQIEKDRRDGIIRSALSAGTISPAESATWRKQLDENEAGTVTLLSALTPRFPTEQVGDPSFQSDFAASEQAEWDAWADQSFGTSLSAKS